MLEISTCGGVLDEKLQGPNGVWNVFGGKLDWGPEAIVRDDPNFQGHGNPSTGNVSFPGVVVTQKYYVPWSIST